MSFIPATWLRYLPNSLRARIEHRPHLQKALTNTGWLFADRFLRMGVGLLVSVWVARYLGPEQFGLYSYATAFVALFSVIAPLGLYGIVVRDLVKEPENANVTLGTAFLMQIIGGLLAFGLTVYAINLARPDDTLVKLVVAVLGFALVFKATEIVRYWFESQVQSKYTVWVDNGVFLLLAAIKVALILNQAPLMTFVWAAFAESLLVSVGLVVVYAWRGGKFRVWRGQYQRARTLFKDSWPLILSGLAIMLYMRIDQIMLGQMLGDKAVGIYSVAVRISEVWYFIPAAIVASVFPSIIEARKQSETLYYQRLQKLYDMLVILAVMVAIPMTFISGWIILKLFGHSYQPAGPVLSIIIWSGVFAALSVSSGRWFINEGYVWMALKRNLFGALVNVGFNFYLIPLYGILGAAYSTLIAFMVSAYISDAFSSKTRVVFLQKTKSIFFINLLYALRNR